MSFGVIAFTNRGRALQAKAQAGAQLVFTRIAVGDGQLGGQAIADLTALIHEVKSIPLNKFKTLPNGKAVIGGVLSNQDLTTGFYWRELGIFAQDPDLGEILYCYGNAGELAEYIPGPGGAEILEKQIDVVVIVGNVQNISATIDQSLVFETPAGAQEKAAAALEAANNYTDQAVSIVRQDLMSHKADITNQIALKANKDYVDEQLALKVSKGNLKRIDLDITSDANLWDINDMNEATRAIILGLEPGEVNAVLGRKNVTTKNAAFIAPGKNRFNKNDVIIGKGLDVTNGRFYDNEEYCVSGFIEVEANVTYSRSTYCGIAFYSDDSDDSYISGIISDNTPFTTPAETKFIRVVVRLDRADLLQIEEGEVSTTLEPYKEYLKGVYVNEDGLDDKILAQLYKINDIPQIANINLEKKNRALIISCDYPNYALDWIGQMNEDGFTTHITTWPLFAKHIDEFISQYEILLFSSMSDELDPLTNVSASEVVDALQKWKDSGNKYLYYCHQRNYAIFKRDLDGNIVESEAYYPNIVEVYNDTYTGGDETEFVYSEEYPLDIELLVPGRITGVGNKRKWTTPLHGLYTSLIEVELPDAKVPVVVYRPNVCGLVSHSGSISGDFDNAAHFNYVHAGKLARAVIGDSPNIKLALDCNNAKKVAASGYDCDITDELQAIKPIVEAYGQGRGLELGIVADKVTPEIANFYRTTGAEIVSHSKSHYTTTLKITTEEYEIPSSRVITLRNPYRVELQWVKNESETVEFTRKDFKAAISETEYGYDNHARLKFHSEQIGNTIKVRYSYLEEAQEWIGSLKVLEQYGALTKPAVYLTAGYRALSGASMMYAEKNDIVFCDHRHTTTNRRNDYLISEYARPAMIPLLEDYMQGDSFLTDSGFDHYVKNYNKEDAKTAFLNDLARLRSTHRPFVWYSHDFLFSEVHSSGIWAGSNPYGWKQATYEETVEYIKEFLEWYLDQIDNENVCWMTRSDYVSFYNTVTNGISYAVLQDGELVVRNNSKKPLYGVTFRDERGITPTNVISIPNGTVKVNQYNNNLLMSVDLMPGETKIIRWS